MHSVPEQLILPISDQQYAYYVPDAAHDGISRIHASPESGTSKITYATNNTPITSLALYKAVDQGNMSVRNMHNYSFVTWCWAKGRSGVRTGLELIKLPISDQQHNVYVPAAAHDGRSGVHAVPEHVRLLLPDIV